MDLTTYRPGTLTWAQWDNAEQAALHREEVVIPGLVADALTEVGCGDEKLADRLLEIIVADPTDANECPARMFREALAKAARAFEHRNSSTLGSEYYESAGRALTRALELAAYQHVEAQQ